MQIPLELKATLMKRSTRGIKLDYANLGDKLIVSGITCHKCKGSISDATQNN